MTQPKQPESNGLAVASLVLGILSMTGFSIFTGIPAIITGAIGLKSPVNKGMSLAGVIMGSISVVLAVLLLILILFLIFIGALASSSDAQDSSGYSTPPSSSVRQRI
jgi:uncharacterized membrane protein